MFKRIISIALSACILFTSSDISAFAGSLSARNHGMEAVSESDGSTDELFKDAAYELIGVESEDGEFKAASSEEEEKSVIESMKSESMESEGQESSVEASDKDNVSDSKEAEESIDEEESEEPEEKKKYEGETAYDMIYATLDDGSVFEAEGIMPLDATLCVKELSDEDALFYVKENIDEDYDETNVIFAYDISIIDKEGIEFEPDEDTVKIHIESKKVEENIDDEMVENCSLYHVSNEAVESEDVKADEVKADVEADGQVKFEADGFSAFIMIYDYVKDGTAGVSYDFEDGYYVFEQYNKNAEGGHSGYFLRGYPAKSYATTTSADADGAIATFSNKGTDVYYEDTDGDGITETLKGLGTTCIWKMWHTDSDDNKLPNKGLTYTIANAQNGLILSGYDCIAAYGGSTSNFVDLERPAFYCTAENQSSTRARSMAGMWGICRNSAASSDGGSGAGLTAPTFSLYNLAPWNTGANSKLFAYGGNGSTVADHTRLILQASSSTSDRGKWLVYKLRQRPTATNGGKGNVVEGTAEYKVLGSTENNAASLSSYIEKTKQYDNRIRIYNNGDADLYDNSWASSTALSNISISSDVKPASTSNQIYAFVIPFNNFSGNWVGQYFARYDTYYQQPNDSESAALRGNTFVNTKTNILVYDTNGNQTIKSATKPSDLGMTCWDMQYQATSVYTTANLAASETYAEKGEIPSDSTIYSHELPAYRIRIPKSMSNNNTDVSWEEDNVSIKVTYPLVGTYKEDDGTTSLIGAVVDFNNFMPTSPATSTVEYSENSNYMYLSVSPNFYNGFVYQNMKAMTINVEFYRVVSDGNGSYKLTSLVETEDSFLSVFSLNNYSVSKPTDNNVFTKWYTARMTYNKLSNGKYESQNTAEKIGKLQTDTYDSNGNYTGNKYPVNRSDRKAADPSTFKVYQNEDAAISVYQQNLWDPINVDSIYSDIGSPLTLYTTTYNSGSTLENKYNWVDRIYAPSIVKGGVALQLDNDGKTSFVLTGDGGAWTQFQSISAANQFPQPKKEITSCTGSYHSLSDRYDGDEKVGEGKTGDGLNDYAVATKSSGVITYKVTQDLPIAGVDVNSHIESFKIEDEIQSGLKLVKNSVKVTSTDEKTWNVTTTDNKITVTASDEACQYMAGSNALGTLSGKVTQSSSTVPTLKVEITYQCTFDDGAVLGQAIKNQAVSTLGIRSNEGLASSENKTSELINETNIVYATPFNGALKAIKTDEDGNVITTPATFGLYTKLTDGSYSPVFIENGTVLSAYDKGFSSTNYNNYLSKYNDWKLGLTKYNYTSTTNKSGEASFTVSIPGEYYIKEEVAPTGYLVDPDYHKITVVGNKTDIPSVTVSDVLANVDVSVEVVWDDLDNKYGVRPNSTGEVVNIGSCVIERPSADKDKTMTANKNTATATTANKWYVEFEDLPGYTDRKLNIYSASGTVPTYYVEYKYVRGDVTGTHKVTVANNVATDSLDYFTSEDVAMIKAAIGQTPSTWEAYRKANLTDQKIPFDVFDANNDGKITQADADLVNSLIGTPPYNFVILNYLRQQYRTVKINIQKKNASGTALEGVSYKITYKDGTSTTVKTDKTGTASVSFKDDVIDKRFPATITEVSTLTGYELLSESLTATLPITISKTAYNAMTKAEKDALDAKAKVGDTVIKKDDGSYVVYEQTFNVVDNAVTPDILKTGGDGMSYAWLLGLIMLASAFGLIYYRRKKVVR